MSERITVNNLDEVIKRNKEIHAGMMQKALVIRTIWNRMQINSTNQLAMQILKSYGLVQIPLDNPYWGGAIFVKNEKKIPVINTALPRANQYYTAWHEIYHLIFDQVSFSHVIETETVMEERKAEYFASLMILGNLLPYYNELPEMEFLSKIFHCMDAFQAPYKAVLIALYESAVQNGNQTVMTAVNGNFDLPFSDMVESFRALGLDDSLVRPSYVINVSGLQSKIQEKIKTNPELDYNYDNRSFLEGIVKKFKQTMEEGNA